MVQRVFVEKRREFAVKAAALKEEFTSFLNVKGITDVRFFIRYDVEHVSGELFERALNGIFAEPPLDYFYLEALPNIPDAKVFAVEPLPGQYDQRADSAAQCLCFLDEEAKPVVQCADVYLLTGDISDEELERIRAYCVNPVDSRIAPGEKPETLRMEYDEPDEVEVLQGLTTEPDEALEERFQSLSLAMTLPDFYCIRDYFRDTAHRDPTITEIRVLDTYWSDHCRHTTFATVIDNVTFSRAGLVAPVRESYKKYLEIRKELYPDAAAKQSHPVCLMDIALAGMKKLRADGILTDMEESEENNACSVVIDIPVKEADGTTRNEEWLLFFKNETHNHPTEIEPFGGAATCLGGAIRDPLSGRGYVYQAMRITGAADPTVPVTETLPGKLPQKKIVTEAAHGYSSYGNQIGLTTGYVNEIYHPGYMAKRMEVGAVVGAAKRSQVQRVRPREGDLVVLLGGRTGRDGIGGATGSSKAHTAESILRCGAEVQKGNAVTERKIQRMFRRPEVSSMILKCNDFGAGGVSVAIGELADGVDIDLDKVPLKYEGLNGTELAISESQERMAVVIAPENKEDFLFYAGEENLEAVVVAKVTEERRLKMQFRGRTIVDLSRDFLDTNGAAQHARAHVAAPEKRNNPFEQISPAAKEQVKADDYRSALLSVLTDLNVCSKRGLVEMFDASIGAGSVMMPYGGKYQLSPTAGMAAKIPVMNGDTNAVSLMAYGFDPYLSAWSPYHGAVYAVIQSLSALIAMGTRLSTVHLSLQEYFRRMEDKPDAYGEVLSALLGALSAQCGMGIAAIGGKDSMSGTFDQIHVPPTLISFAVGTGYQHEVITPEFKEAGNTIVEFRIPRDEQYLPDYDALRTMYGEITECMRKGHIISCNVEDAYGLAPCAVKMSFGNNLGLTFEETMQVRDLFENGIGNLVAEVRAEGLTDVLRIKGAMKVGTLKEEPYYTHRQTSVLIPEALQCFTSRLTRVFPVSANPDRDGRAKLQRLGERNDLLYHEPHVHVCKEKTARPRVFIPVMPGTNCEYDLARAFERAGALVQTEVFRNDSPNAILGSFERFTKTTDNAQILMFPGGFSAGDEPDGSAKFFAAAFRNERLSDAVQRLLNERDGLILGICNGFQAMIKLGLVPYGEIRPQTEHAPTLTVNTIGRHISRMAHLRVTSDKSPWLSLCDPGELYLSPVSHGEGRFVASEEVVTQLYENGQIATRYCDDRGNITMDDQWNLNGSIGAIEGITSADGRCYGKMAHAERTGEGLLKNVPGNHEMKLFEAGVRYFQ